MATTKTYSQTQTFTRAEVLAAQISYVVAATTDRTSFDAVTKKGIVENEWIEVINVHAVDSDGKIRTKITMRIDWDLHRLYIRDGRDKIVLDGARPIGEQLSKAVGRIVKFFCEQIEEKGLKSEWTLNYKHGVDGTLANRELGLSTGTRREWAKGEVIHVLGDVPSAVDEFSIDLSVVVPKGPGSEPIAGRKRGVVKWFAEAKGFGFIIPEEGGSDIYVHFSQIEGHGRRILETGQKVEFTVEKHSRGLRATNVSVIA